MTPQLVRITTGAIGYLSINSLDFSRDPNPWGSRIALRRIQSDGSRSRYQCECVRCGHRDVTYGSSLTTARRVAAAHPDRTPRCGACKYMSDEQAAESKSRRAGEGQAAE